MKNKTNGLCRSFGVFLVFQLFFALSYAQLIKRTIQPAFNKKRVGNNRLPFGKIEIADRRFDTSLFYINESGNYPVEYTIFEKGLRTSFEDYFGDAIAQLPHGDNELLIKLNQCRIPNRQLIKRRKGEYNFRAGRMSHERLLLDAQVYKKINEGSYLLVEHVEKKYIVTKTITFQSLVNEMLDDILMAITKSTFFSVNNKKGNPGYLSDTTTIGRAGIDADPFSRWKRMNVMSASFDKNGIFETFDDFRDNVIKEERIRLDSITRDSICYFSGINYDITKWSQLPYAVVYNGVCYIHFSIGLYLPITKDNGAFYFYVPGSLPDMYALLSYEYYRFGSVASPGHYGTPGEIALSLAIDAATGPKKDKQKYQNTILVAGLKNHFRHCVIDLDNGDFIYFEQAFSRL